MRRGGAVTKGSCRGLPAHASPEEADSQGRPVVVPGLEVGTRGAAVSWAQSSRGRCWG